jgi:hypothetical protein
MIEDHNSIDMITQAKDGSISLVMTDAGTTEDPQARFDHFEQKLKTYYYYLIAGGFAAEHPDLPLSKVTISVICAHPPTKEMAEITGLKNPANPEEKIRVVFRHLPLD